jgi:hypothetical protein
MKSFDWESGSLGLFFGFCIGLFIVLSLATAGTPTYTIESIATEDGIEYTVFSNVKYRKDVLYKTMDSTTAWTIWYGLYANRVGEGYEVQTGKTPNINNGVYHPDDYAKKGIFN